MHAADRSLQGPAVPHVCAAVLPLQGDMLLSVAQVSASGASLSGANHLLSKYRNSQVMVNRDGVLTIKGERMFEASAQLTMAACKSMLVVAQSTYWQ